MKILFPALLLCLIAFPAFAAKSIRCVESDVDNFEDDKPISTTTILLDAKGRATSLKISRRAYEGGPALSWSFNAKNSTFSHGIQKNEIDSIDEETKEVYYIWRIEDVEVVEASNANGQKVRIVINDHRYSGTPGSSLFLNEKKSAYNLDCEGAVKLPMSRLE